MDEQLVEQISSSSGIPQMLVSRSAQARAEASGVSVNDVLNLSLIHISEPTRPS